MTNNLYEEEPRPARQPWFHRNGFPDALVAVVWTVVALILFQVVAAIVGIGLVMYQEGVSGLTEDMIGEHIGSFIIGNSAGQITGLLIATLLIARLSVVKSEYNAFMRFRMPDQALLTFVFAVLVMLVAQPLVWYLGWLNQLIPLPETIELLERSQVEMIENLLTGGFALWFLVLNVGLVPAVCEEVMFRSYLHRLFENSFGIIAALIITAVLFGLFHFRLSQLLPLSMIGLLLGWMTVKSGSVFPAILMHFIHNSGTVTAVHTNPELLETAEATTAPPLLLVAASLILTGLLIYLYHKWNTSQPKQE